MQPAVYLTYGCCYSLVVQRKRGWDRTRQRTIALSNDLCLNGPQLSFFVFFLQAVPQSLPLALYSFLRKTNPRQGKGYDPVELGPQSIWCRGRTVLTNIVMLALLLKFLLMKPKRNACFCKHIIC